MRTHRVRFFGLLSIPLVLALFTPSRAAADRDDPPSRVARLSKIQGSVSFEPAGTKDWVSAVVNRPMTTGDRLWTDRGSRAELHLGSASIRLGSRTGFSFLNLNDNATQIRLAEGTLRLRVKRLYSRETFEVDTPNLAFSILRPGTYRFNVNGAGDVTAITVSNGEGEVTGGGQYFTVRARETAIFSGNDRLSADFQEMYRDDDFDRWCMDRDRREDRSLSVRYVSPDAIGYEDLDEYGWWRPVPEYGQVWFPRVTVVGWAPYRYGHWVYIWPWGYTWVEDEPWGFAPFHYGRWIVVGGSWGWVPCPPAVVGIGYARPVYAPALVAWVGGRHWGVSVSIGGGSNVGWFPLGPHEVYMPSYEVSRTYVQNVNITNTTVNTTVINNYYNTTVVNHHNDHDNEDREDIRYVNRNVNGAVTVTSQDTLTSAQPVHSHMVRVNEGELENTRVAITAPQLTPEKQAVLGSGHHVDATPPEEVMERRVVARTAPPSPSPSFEEQHAAMQENDGRSVPLSHMRRARFEDEEAAGVKLAPGTHRAPAVQGDGDSWGNQAHTNAGDRADGVGNRPSDGQGHDNPSLTERGERANNPLPREVHTRPYGDRPPEARPSIEESGQPAVDRRRELRDEGRAGHEQPRVSEDRPQQSEERRQPQVDRRHEQQEQDRPRYQQPRVNEDRPQAAEERRQPQSGMRREQMDQERPNPRYEQPRVSEDRPQQSEERRQPQVDRRHEQQEQDRPRYEQPRQQERAPEQRQQPQPQERPMPQPQHERPAPEPQHERPVERSQPQQHERPQPEPQERARPQQQEHQEQERARPQRQEREEPQQ
jgi:hypothetical protein